jgi:autotransporter-associated beta strand protein
MAVILSLMMAVPVIWGQDDPAAHTVIVPYDVEKPVSAQKAERYYLDRATFEKLWSLAKENRMPVADEAVKDSPLAVVHSALHRVTVEEGRLLIQSRFTVASRGRWAQVAMRYAHDTDEKNAGPDGGLVMRDWRVDGRPAAFTEGVISLETPGMHEVEVTVEMKRMRGWSHVRLKTPQAEAGMVSLTVPVTDGSPVLGEGVMVTEEAADGDARAFTAMLGARDVLEITRRPRRPRADEEPPAVADERLLVTASADRADAVVADIRFEFPGTERTRFSVILDADLRLDGWRLSREGRVLPLKQWTLRVMEGRRVMDFDLATPVAEGLQMLIEGSRSFVAGARKTPFIEPVASRGKRVIGLLHDESVSLNPQPTATQRRVERPDAKSLVMVGARGQVTELHFQSKAAEPLAYTLGRAVSKRECKADYVFQLHPHKLEMMVALTLRDTRESWSQFRLGMPAGFEVQSVSGTALAGWKREGDDLILHWQPGIVLPEARLVVYLARPSPEARQQWALQPLRLADFSKHEGTALIVAHAAMDARLEGFVSAPDLKEVDPSARKTAFAVAPPQTVHRAVTFERGDWTLTAALTRQPARFSADTVALAQATEAGLLVSQQVALQVEGGALARVTLKMPATLPEAEVRGEALREVQTRVNGAVREYDCSFQTDILGRTTLALDVGLPPAATQEVPFIEVVGAERLRRFFVLDNASRRESRVLESAGVEACAKSALPYLPEVMTQPVFYQGKGATAGRLRIGYEELKSTEGNAAIVTLADITSVWRGDGERWDTVVYSIFNRSLQFLPVILPEKAELIAASVSGAAVRADEQTGTDGRRVRLIPLIQTRAGQRSLEVRLVYRLRQAMTPAALMRQGTLRMDDPEIPGISAERTTWTAILPKRFAITGVDGNMEEVAEESRLAEKLQGWLADLGRINRSLSSKEAYYDSKESGEYAIREAEKLVKQIEEVTKQADDGNNFKKQLELSKDGAKPLLDLGKDDDGKEKALRRQVDGDLEKVREELRRQTVTLTENKISQPVFSTRKSGEKGNRLLGNAWNVNGGSVSTAKPTEFDDFINYGTPIQIAATDALGYPSLITLNDNVVARGEFLKVPVSRDSAVMVNGGIAGVSDVSKLGAGKAGLGGTNTYTGAVTIAGGELQANPERSVDLDAPVSEPSMRADAGLHGDGFANLSEATTESLEAKGPSFNNSRANAFKGKIVAGGRDTSRSGTAAITPGNVDGLLPPVQAQSAGQLVAGAKIVSTAQNSAITLPNADVMDMPDLSKMEDEKARSLLNNAVADSMQGRVGGGFGVGAAPLAPASPVLPPADPFGMPAPMIAVAEPAKKTAIVEFDPPEIRQSRGLEAQLANQLRVKGRQSLAVEIPSDGRSYHFRKLKDHAVLELKIKRAWTSGQKNQAVVLGAGFVIWLGLVAWKRRTRQPPRHA